MTSHSDVEVLIVGAGAMGLSTAWALTRRGRSVRVVEQFSPHHHLGASHGTCRNFNPAYGEPELLAMIRESRRLWTELEAESGRQLLDLVGVVTHGPGPVLGEISAALGRAGIPAQVLSEGDAGARWRGIRFATDVLHTPDSGRLRAAESLTALAEVAERGGAQISWNTKAIRIEPGAPEDGGATVTVQPQSAAGAGAGAGAVQPAGDSERIRARVVVSAVNAWTTKFVGGLGLFGDLGLPTLTVTQETPVHFSRWDDSLHWPSFNHIPDRRHGADYWLSTIYGMLTPGEGVKAGWHRVGPMTDPDARSFRSVPEQTLALQRYARDWLPGVDADEVEEISCTYTSSDDAYFLIDRAGPIVVLAGFAGEGFKFVPSVGRMAADLVDGVAQPGLFSMSRSRRRPADGAPGTVLGAV